MANVSITDGFGLVLQASLNPASGLAQYFQQPLGFSALQHDLASLQDLPLSAFPLKSTEIGLTFAPSTVLGAASPLQGSAAVSAILSVVPKGKLFDPDPFDCPIDVPSGRAYLGLGMKVNLAPGGDLTSGKTTFGFAAGSTVCLAHYQPFLTTATMPTFKAALQACLQDYVMPFAPDDLDAMGVGNIAIIEGTGCLQVSGTLNLLTTVNPLASVSAAASSTTLSIREGAAIDVSACFTISGNLQIRIQKVDTGTVRMGIYRKLGTEFTVQITPSVGITAGTTKTDFMSAVLGAVTPSPFPSAGQLEAAGLSKEKQEAIESALKSAIQRNLALSVEEELQALSSHEAAFLYEINLKDLGPDGRKAIQEALRLNLSALSASAQLPQGIREIQNLITTSRTKRHTLKLNLIGIYNFDSISDLTLKGTVLTDPASGEVVITDSANATRISSAVNFLADSDKLRKLLAQSFLITAVYRGSGLISHAPSLKVSYWHFAERAQTDHSTMGANLNVVSSLGLITAARKAQSLTHAGDFGRSTFYLSTEYDDALTQALFLGTAGEPRALDEYEQIGRTALQLLIQPGGEDEFRLRALQNDAVWQQVKQTGGTIGNLAQIFPDLSQDLQIPIIAGDYVLIAWWATAMARMAKSVSTAKQFFSQHPQPAADDPAFQKVQADLWHQMTEVARNTQDRFAEPWGMLVMDLASGQRSAASARIVSAGLTLGVERAQPLASKSSLASAV